MPVIVLPTTATIVSTRDGSNTVTGALKGGPKLPGRDFI
jgi:hypothetical protein